MLHREHPLNGGQHELRGGTHLLLLEVDQLAGEGVAESLTGQFHERFSEQFAPATDSGSVTLSQARTDLGDREIVFVGGNLPNVSPRISYHRTSVAVRHIGRLFQ